MTISDLAAPWLFDLPAAMRTAAWPATEAGLEFVLAPVPTSAGQIVGSLELGNRQAIEQALASLDVPWKWRSVRGAGP